ncbi:hypothetical protein PUN28_015825 [Cardiocondyla obscurior]|uniref:Uncharacterized protein n=1 Tax=Cardiocondyla obscurior TaxID=286306 RepID=A0AAW2EPG3_9HYME
MYTNPFNRKHSTIRQMLDRLLDPTKKPIRRSESVCSSSSNDSSKGNHGSFGRMEIAGSQGPPGKANNREDEMTESGSCTRTEFRS